MKKSLTSVFRTFILLTLLIQGCTTQTKQAVTQTVMRTEESVGVSDEDEQSKEIYFEKISMEIVDDPNYQLSYVRAYEKVYGSFSEQVLTFIDNIEKSGEQIDDTSGTFGITKYGFLYYRTLDGSKMFFSKRNSSDDLLKISLQDSFDILKADFPEIIGENDTNSYFLSPKDENDAWVVLYDKVNKNYSNFIFSIDSGKWFYRPTTYDFSSDYPEEFSNYYPTSDEEVITLLAQEFYSGEIDYPNDLLLEQKLSFEDFLHKIETSQPSYTYNAINVDPRIIRTLNKGVIWNVFIQNDVLSIRTVSSIENYDLSTNQELSRIPLTFSILDLALSPDGAYLIITKLLDADTYATTLSVWDVKTGEIVWEEACPGYPISLAVNPTNNQISVSMYFSSDKKQIRFYNIEDSKRHSGKIDIATAGLLLFSSDGSRLIHFTNSQIDVYDSETNLLIASSPCFNDKIRDYYLSNDSSLLLIDNKVYKESSKGSFDFSFTLNEGSWGFYGDTNQIISKSRDILDPNESGKNIGQIVSSCVYNDIYYSMNNNNGVGCINGEGAFIFYNIDENIETIVTNGYFGSPSLKAISHDGKYLLTSSNLSTSLLTLWNLDLGAPIQTFRAVHDTEYGWCDAAISVDNSLVAARMCERGLQSNQLYVWDVESGKQRTTINSFSVEGNSTLGGLVFAYDNDRILYSLSPNKLSKVNLENGEIETIYQNFQYSFSKISLSVSGKYAFLQGDLFNDVIVRVNLIDYSFDLFNVPAIDLEIEAMDDEKTVYVFYREGDNYDFGIMQINIETGNIESDIQINPLSFPDGESISIENNLIAMGCNFSFPSCNANTAEIFDLTTGKHVKTFGYEYPASIINDLTFINGGENLVSLVSTIDIWDVSKILE